MAHQRKGRKLGRISKQRGALMRSLARSLILKGRIQTTEAKAKELRPFIERLITHGRQGGMAKRRLVLSRLGDPKATDKLFTDIGPRYVSRPGGYTRITKILKRTSDGRSWAIIELMGE